VSTHLQEKQEKIQKIIDKLIEASEKGKAIIVEGKKDNQALKELGVNGVILTVKSGGKSFLEATWEIEKLGAKEVVLLLDFDRRGREGTKRLQQDLERAQIKVNLRFWRELKGLISRDIQCIESLPSYLGSFEQKVAE